MPSARFFTGAITFASAALQATAFFSDDDCSYFYDLQCTSGDQTTNPPDWAERSFQTYLPGSAKYKDAYEGLGKVMCYNQITYSADRSSATVEAKCRQHSSVDSLQYNWNGEGYTDSATYQADSSLQDVLSLVVKATVGDQEYTITPESLNFIW